MRRRERRLVATSGAGRLRGHQPVAVQGAAAPAQNAQVDPHGSVPAPEVGPPVCHNGNVTPNFTRSVRAAVLVAFLGVTATACSTPKTSAPTTDATTTTVAATTTTTGTAVTIPPATVPVPTTAAPVVPPAPQPSAEDAANALVSYWASGNRTTALRVATPQAVATLFAAHYPSGLAINRGCTDAFPPLICTYGAPGGGPTNAPIYQLYESQAPGGWYVSSVQIQ
jgi:hypothetical protein